MSLSSNFFANLPTDLPEEFFETILESDHLRIERIVSLGQSSPEGFVGDQTIDLAPGDFINLPAHTRHRVEWTKPDEPTVWLAIFY